MFPLLTPAPSAIDLLHAWDARRASAYVHDDPGALSRLYVDHSGAGPRDLALLRSYDSAGVRVRSMDTQVFASRVSATARGRVVIDLVDRVLATGDDGRRCVQVPASPPRSHRVVLRQVGGRWLMESVRSPTPR